MNIDDILKMLGMEPGNGDDENNNKILNDLTFNKFMMMVDRYNMTCEYTIEEKSGYIVIVENWSSEINKNIKLNRIYPFSVSHIDLIDEPSRKDILERILDKYVENENYEEAAEIRDIIGLM